MSNYHKIKAFINTVHSYSDTLYGASERTFGLLKLNAIKIKNTFESILRISSKAEKNVIQITNIPTKASVDINAKIEKNNIFINNALFSRIISTLELKESIIAIENKCISFIAKIMKEEQVIKIQNSIEHLLHIAPQVDENDIIIADQTVSAKLQIEDRPELNYTCINNPDINAAAWFFVRLEAMSGGLNNYYNQTIEDTGRRKIV